MRTLSRLALACAICTSIFSCSPKPAGTRICTAAETELTGCGNRNEVLTRIDVMAEGHGVLTGVDVILTGAEAMEAVRVSEGTPYPAGPDCRPSARRKAEGRSIRTKPGRSEYHIPCRIKVDGKTTVSICADVKDNAAEGTRLSAKVVSATISGICTRPTADNAGYREVILARRLLYAPGDYNSLAWRIPAILQLSDGTLLTVNDKRNDSEEDLPGRIDVAFSYSTDNGRTWSEPGYIAKSTGFMGGFGDPSLAQLPDGTVICMMCGGETFSRSSKNNPQRSFFATSNDFGRTWSEPQEITSQLWGDEGSDPHTAAYKSNFFSSGNCLVLQKGEHKGRMLTAGVFSKVGKSSLFNHAVYTDDGGASWHASEIACPYGDEAKMVELRDGSILMSIRTIGNRLWTISNDGGETWGPVQSWKDIRVTNCNGDLIRYDDNTLIHSIPYSMKRENVSVLLSFDDGETWSERKTILEGDGQYSSLTVLQDGTIGAYLEKNTWGTELWYMNFSMDWVRSKEKAEEQATAITEGTRLWEGGPIWANCNIGAESPEQSGLYYAWGELSPSTTFGWNRYRFGDLSEIRPYPAKALKPCDDVATVTLGDGWRIPTEQDFKDLCDKCSWTWGQSEGVNGFTVSGELGSIFLPATGYRSGSRHRYAGDLGYYWTATPSGANASQAREFYFHQFFRGPFNRGRDNGHVIRAIKD